MMHHYVDTTEQLTNLSTCTGIGGLERGVERVTGPLRTIAYVEIEAAIIENLVVGMEAGRLAPAPVWTNFKTFDFRPVRHKLFFLMGGYPCQPFSHAGHRRGKDDPRHLWPYFERGIYTARPVCVFFENVLGHLSLGFDQVVHSLRRMGYAVEAGVFTASEVGAPHKRARVFILGILANAKDDVRGLYERSWRPGTTRADFTGSGEMDHARSIRYESEYPVSARGNGAELAGEAMADTHSDGPGTNPGGIIYTGSEIESPEQRTEWDQVQRQWDGTDSWDGRTVMADGIGQGLEEWREQHARQEREAIERGGCIDRWPAGPGQPQFDWECPRVIKRGVGSTINGYDFREDLLRALGNGVVEQTAELALRTLLRKHFE